MKRQPARICSRRRLALTALLLLATCAAADPAEQDGEVLILGSSSSWRYHYSLKPVPILTGGKMENGKFEAWWLETESPTPPQGWHRQGFDDSGWQRMPGWNPQSPFIGLICMRGKFNVTDPNDVKALNLSLAYQGGVVVYLNGEQIARGHLPKDANFDTPAEMYPPETAKAAGPRTRTLEGVAVDPKLLRKGVNVLAIELHRAPHRRSDLKKERRNIVIDFAHCGYESIRLTASGGHGVVPNLARPRGLQVWNSDPMAADFDLDFGDSNEPLRPIRIVGTRNGAFSGKVVVGSTQPIIGLQAAVSDFRQNGGTRRIASSAVQIRYPRPDGYQSESESLFTVEPSRFDALEEVAPKEVPVRIKARARRSRKLPGEPDPIFGAVQPVWVTVNVPAAAASGQYEATLTVRAKGLNAISVPVKLTVCAWTMPDPAEFRTFAEFAQSPETLALRYNVPIYSDKHFELIAKSLKLIGQAGNKTCYIPLICHTNQGNEQSMVRWVKKPDGTYRHDFSVMEKYLDLVEAHQPKPTVVCLYAWDIHCNVRERPEGFRGVVRPSTGQIPVSCLDGEGNVTQIKLPPFGSPGTKELWKPLIDEIVNRLKKRGMDDVLMLGISTDTIPSQEVIAFFEQLLPGVTWVNHSHPRRTAVHDAPVGYSSGVWRGGQFPNEATFARTYGWRRKELAVHHPRSTHDAFPMTTWRFMGEMNITGQQRGFARLGADFFPVLKDRRGRLRATLSARFPKTSWRNLNVRNCLLAAGATGPISTIRFEMLREGLQACEARIFIEKALTDRELRAKIGDELATRCQKILDERVLAMLRAVSTLRGRSAWTQHAYASSSWWQAPGIPGSQWFVSSDWQSRSEALYAAAAEVERKLRSR